MTAPPVFLSSDEPVRSTLLSNIAAQSAVLPTLLNAISAAAVSTSTGGSSSSSNPASSSSSNKSPTAAISAAHNSLVTLDHQLAVLMERARRHQARWQRMLALQEEAVAVESRVRDALIVLESGKRELEGTLKDARVVLAGIETAEKNPTDPQTLLSYASALAPYTSAPPTYNPATQPSTGAFFPPFPAEDVLRRGRLGTAGDLLGNVGETKEVDSRVSDTLQQPAIDQVHTSTTATAAASTTAVSRPKPSHEIFDLDLNSDLDE